MSKALRISVQAFADLSDNELSDVIGEACERSRIENRMYSETERDAHRARKRRAADRERDQANRGRAAPQSVHAA
ncbi:hypothetical protein [Paraburkholderia dioscoreae]|uniref:Uncharacterized protein n=1 Tax=Paraburkholderia dioscoreae TaxID=2604047 RepID=A0A5Q4ZQQ3_9BURK|nr:hypothetical protein [Paraburkholderia dioscoreae]VVD30990.1 conserved protein of unknown function [Paraburkholderia dioscoreae]